MPSRHSFIGRTKLGSGLETAAVSRLPRAPQVIESAFFVILFFTACFLTVLGALFVFSDNPEQTRQSYPILLFNLFLVLFLGAYLSYRTWSILFAKKRHRSAPWLQRRFVLIFSLAALIPALLVGGFTSSLLSRNVNDLFGKEVKQTLNNANSFIDSYIGQELYDLGLETKQIKQFLQANERLFSDRISFTAYLQRYARTTDVDSIYIVDQDGRVMSQVISTNSPELRIPLPVVFEYMSSVPDKILFNSWEEKDYLLTYSRLPEYPDGYLIVGRFMKSNLGILSSLKAISEASTALNKYDMDQGYFQRVFLLTFIETALLVLFTAISVGSFLGSRVIEPLGRMIDAAERVRAGDLSAKVDVKGDWGEMSDLGSAFNRMTRQLNTQREDLIKEHTLSERRRQFSEAVLSGVRAGVMGLSEDGRITLLNVSAIKLLGLDAKTLLGQYITKVLPEFAPTFQEARESVSGMAEDQINYELSSGIRNFDLRVSGYDDASENTGWVLTFDDMTRLVAAQRHSAWREVARRIAHEIKNPLTPILLSAERLKRKYSHEISSNPEIFENCTDTIIRQVGSLEQMVNEFSTFARMPAPVLNMASLPVVIKPVLFAQGVAFPDVEFVLNNQTDGDNLVLCDERLISQALTNIYKNAAESITSRVDRTGVDNPDGLVETTLSVRDGNLVVAIQDNGLGWPLPDTQRLLEPYVTTRETGTGLGLAIVSRIAEDHNGQLVLSSRPDGQKGAYLELTLPLAHLGEGSVKLGNIPLEVSLNET